MNSNQTEKMVLSYLDQISQPAAPFYEGLVADKIGRIAAPWMVNRKITVQYDRFGNLLAHFRNSQKPKFPALAVAAHMDHPGFEPIEYKGKRVKAKIMGGLPRDERLINSKILMIHGPEHFKGIITDWADGNDGKEKSHVWFELDREFNCELEHTFAVPDVERFKVESSMIHGRAMDDLAGCAIQLAALERIKDADIPVDFTAIFHRAEEVGFIGATAACQAQSISKRALVISLEASKNLEGARPGDGVVIRTGDKAFRFDPNAEVLLDKAAETIANSNHKTQKRLMDGGTCEATCYIAHNYETGAAAVPLINYHNGGEEKIEAEAIHKDDLVSGVELIVALADQVAQSNRSPRVDIAHTIQSNFYAIRDRLYTRDFHGI